MTQMIGPAGEREQMNELTIREVLVAARGRLHARLERAIAYPIVMVYAPAGYGKSAVVRDFFRLNALPHRHVEIDPIDGDILGLLRALARSVSGEEPAFASSLVTVYDRLADLPDACEELAEWAAGYLTSIRATIVIDGIDKTTGERVPAFLTSLIDRTRDTIRWFVIPDSSERFPIARWMAEDRMDVPIDMVDLALTKEDLVHATSLSADSPAESQLEKLCALTAGWPAAIVLALASLGVVDLNAAPSEPALLYAYLAESTLSTLSSEGREFVEATCLFSSFDAVLLECAGLSDAGNVLEILCGLGVVWADTAALYQYDELFRTFLRARLRAQGGGAFERIATTSARAYELDGRYAGAIAIYAELGDHRSVAALLSAHGFALMDRGESNVVQRALRSLPHEVVFAFPSALAVKACLESLYGKFDVAEAWFRLALGRITVESQRNEIVYRFAIDLVRRERPDSIELLQPVVAAINQSAPLAAPLVALLATAYASNGQSAEASLSIDRALRLLPSVEDSSARAKIMHQAGFVALHLRDIAAAKAFSLEAYREASACYSFDVAARALSVLYNIAIDYEDDVAATRFYLEQLMQCSARAGSRQLLLYATLCRYEIEVLGGNVLEVERLNDGLRSLEVFFSVLTTETLLPAQALQATWNGDFDRAYRLLEPSAEHQITSDRQAYRYAEIALYAAAAGFRDEASVVADRALALVRQMTSVDKTVLQTMAYVALTFVLIRRRARAAKLLNELSLHAASNGRIAVLTRVVRLLSERWNTPGDATELATALAELEAVDLGGLARMIEALPLPETARSRIGQLTSGERETLEYLCAGMSSREIALSSERSLQAVETRVTLLCRKLGCGSRRHAVALALGEGLFPDALANAAGRRAALGGDT